MRFLRRMWGDKVSLMLFLVSLFMGIGFFTKGFNAPFAEFAFCLYIFFQVNEKGIFFEKLIENYPKIARELDLKINKLPFGIKIKRQGWFATIIQIIILLGTLFLLVMGFKEIVL